jgi:hypothetical protein
MQTRVLVGAACLCLATACSDQSALRDAERRIAQLEAELAAEKAKNAKPALSAAQTNPAPSAATKVPSAVQSESAGLQWQYRDKEDKMTGGTTRSALVKSTNTVRFGPPYGGEQHGRLQLRTDPRYGRDVIFFIERGQLMCRSYEECTVLVRFDEGKPERFSAIGPSDNSSDAVFIRGYDRFLSKMRNSKTIRISISVYQNGDQVFEFDVSGFDQARYSGTK